ncbi:BspA family leucine-rich repeat surface protein [Candidatus Haliotispira prima]|uniref:BspA family leucine-rich repeat surface protein n=1 Tax=Candidatus Haliotispira prima TaxID=3034016 RepID=A0ABY8MJ33_9SPIO|nr:BspA family leucine-rich repeat surface protein [Candidatus Haliotispira prima]
MQNRNKISTNTEIKYLKPKTQSAKPLFLLPNKSPLFLSFCLFLFCFIPLFLSACVKSAEYTVSFETAGGSAVPPVKVADGTGLIAVPTKGASDGTTYYFGGWYTVPASAGHTDETRYDYTKPVTGDITLYARWDAEESADRGTPEVLAAGTEDDTEQSGKQPANKAELKALIAELGHDADLNHIDVSKVTDMSRLFADSDFNGDISGWDVSGVTNMEGMFYNAKKFNRPIGDWNVSGVTNMAVMFYGAGEFNQPIGDWDVSNVIGMGDTFFDAKAFDQDISGWAVQPSDHGGKQ